MTEFTLAQVAEHNTKNDLYIAIRNKVYNVTSFVDDHPGSPDILIDAAGQDCTDGYEDTGHSEEADYILSTLQVGTLADASSPASSICAPPTPVKTDAAAIAPVTKPETPLEEPKSTGVLKPNEFQTFPLLQRTDISHNVAIFRFELPLPCSILGLPTGQHITIAAPTPTGDVLRSYTPISSDHQPGFFDLLVKMYPGGIVTQYLNSLKVGETIRVRGPKGAFFYRPNMVRRLGMVAGGTGLTPMLQIVLEILRGRASGDVTEVDLIFGNVNEEDILLRQDLEELAEMDRGVRIHHVLNHAPDGWTGGVGFVNEDMVRKWLPPPADDVKILLCGPPPMVSAMKKITEGLGYQKARPASKVDDQVFAF